MSHEQSSCTLSKEKQNGKILQKGSCSAESYLGSWQISMVECFCENTTGKSFIIDVWFCLNTPLRLCKILKWN